LAETAAWCGRGAGPLWTPALCPPGIGWEHTRFRVRSTAERQGIVNRLADERARLLAARGPAAPADTTEGRLLVFYPDATLSDGAAGSESDWLFDVDNVPAWDTWVWATHDSRQGAEPLSYHSYLVCWVPPALVERAHDGIRVNPEECIKWAADVDTALTRRLREAGLLK
jgi:hypothetical protein